MSSKVSGMLAEELDPILQQAMIAPSLGKRFPAVLAHITEINKAHVLMLAEQGILTSKQARDLARSIIALEQRDPAEFELDPAREDAYFNYEHALIEHVGSDIGGRVHIGRSRNDLNATIDRLRARRIVLALLGRLLDLRRALVAQANRYRHTIMPGYTHMQPAQPLTFGYFLAGVAHAIERDYQRLAESLPRINRCPLGAGAIAGTSFPIDRAFTSRWLGFDGVMPHAQDCVGTRDFLIEMLSSIALAATTWGRMAQDFYIMTTYEFRTLSFPDRIAQTSSMMPQKKNLTALEYLKSGSAAILGAQVTAIASSRGAQSSLVLDACFHAFHWAWDAFEHAERQAAVAAVVVAAAEPNEERMAELVRDNFSTATDLADALVREAGLSFRDAHHLVGAVVRTAMDRGLSAYQIDASHICEAGQRSLGRPVVLAPASLAAAVDPEHVAEARRGTGGPASADMATMLDDLQANCRASEEDLRKIEERLAAAKSDLDAAFAMLAAGRA